MVLLHPTFYDKRNDFDSDIVSFPFFDGDISRSTSYLYVSAHSVCQSVYSCYWLKHSK